MRRILPVFLLLFFTIKNMQAQRYITFSGIKWLVKDSRVVPKGPGNNWWSDDAESVWVDEEGALHLRIRNIGGKWFSAEVISQETFGYGSYTFFLASNIERYDPNIVVGLFAYEDDKNEIDIEFSQWGNPDDVYGGYTVQPEPYTTENQYRFPLNLNGLYSTHKFTWKPKRIRFESFHDHFEQIPSNDYLIQKWTYTGAKIPREGHVHLHINFWLFSKDIGTNPAPQNHKEAELIVKAVRTPYAFRQH